MEDFIIKYWLEVIFGAILGLIGLGYKKIKKKQEEQENMQKEQERKNQAIENGVQALLRNELIKNFREYKIKGEISLLDKENMEHMFTEYFNLGGNGMMQEVHEEFINIPIKVIK
jgi:hypothetical protein